MDLEQFLERFKAEAGSFDIRADVNCPFAIRNSSNMCPIEAIGKYPEVLEAADRLSLTPPTASLIIRAADFTHKAGTAAGDVRERMLAAMQEAKQP